MLSVTRTLPTCATPSYVVAPKIIEYALEQARQLMRAGASGGWGLGVVIASLMGVDGLAWNDLSPYFGVRREHTMEANQMQPRTPSSTTRAAVSSADASLRSMASTVAPSRAKRNTVARPFPIPSPGL